MDYHLERGGMPLHKEAGVNCKNCTTILKIKEQVLSIWGMGYILDNCVLVICHDMTTPPGWRENVILYYYYDI